MLPFTSSFPVLVTARYTLQQSFVYVFAVVQGEKLSQIQPCDVIKMRKMREELERKSLKKRWIIPYDVKWLNFLDTLSPYAVVCV